MSAKVLRHPSMLKRAYEAAGVHPALAGWISASVPSDVDIYAGLRQLRARSRDAAANDDHMKFFLELIETNVIGDVGITVQAKPLLASGAQDKTTAKRIEQAWAEQCELGAWDSTGQLDRTQFDMLGVRTVAQDGEVLIRIHEPDSDSPTGWSVELVDPEALDIDYNALLPNGNWVRMGVEMTPRRRPVAYHLFRESPILGAGYQSGYSRTERLRIPAEDLIHAYLPKLVWGSRGIPWAHTALRRMKMLSGYEEAGITAARGAAVKTSAYQAHEWANPETRPDGTLEDGRFTQDLEPGAAERVPYGWELKPLDWAWPNIEHGEFVKDCLRGIASGLGVSYNTLANDLEGVNYSSLRQGALQERDQWRKIQSWWISRVTCPLYRRWLAFAVRSGRITKGNGLSYQLDRMTSLSNAAFVARRWPWVDPLKDQQANKESVLLGTRSISDVIRDEGRDPQEVWDELQADREAMSNAGLPLPGATPPASAAAPNADPANTDPNSGAADGAPADQTEVPPSE